MDLFEAIRQRRSIRKYGVEPVSQEAVEAILRAAIMAPSGLNQQPWHFLVIRSEEKLREMGELIAGRLGSLGSLPEYADLAGQIRGYRSIVTFFCRAPLVVAVLLKPYDSISLALIDRVAGEPDRRFLGASAPFQSIGAAIQNMHLVAHTLGYGSCSVTGPLFMAAELERLLGVEPPWRLVAFVPIGLPAEKPAAPRRKPLEEVCSFID